MNRIAVARIAWKEWRVQREFVLAMLLMGVTAQWVLRAPLRIGWSEHATFTLGAALVATVFYALGCGAILFALERERKTDGFLQSLPVSGMDTVWGKLAFAAISTLVVGLVLVSPAIPEALLIPGARLSPPAMFGHASYRGTLGVGLLLAECFAWTALFSMRTRTVMTAFLLSLAAIGLIDFVAVPALVFALPTILSGPDAATVMEQWIRAGVIAVVLAAIVITVRGVKAAIVLTVRGGDRAGWGFPDQSAPKRIQMPRPARAARTAPAHRHRWGGLRRMVWQHGKASFPWLAATLVCSLILLSYWVAGIRPMSGIHAGRFDVQFVFLCIVLIPPAVFGVLTFHGDQLRSSFRFATEMGIQPGMLWRSRHVIPGLCTIGWMLLIWVTRLALLQGAPASTRYGSELPALGSHFILFAAYLSLSTFTCYAAGQYYSQMIRSGVLAVVCTLVSAGVLTAWTALMAFSHVPVWWSVLPIPLLLLWVTYRRTLPWMTERLTGTERVRTAAWLTIPILLMLCGIAAFRAFELPPAQPAAFHIERAATAPSDAALETGKMYAQALATLQEQYPNAPGRKVFSVYASVHSSFLPSVYTSISYPLSPADPAQASANAAAIDLVEQAGYRPHCVFPSAMFGPYPGKRGDDAAQIHGLAGLILSDAVRALANGDLDLAWRRCESVLRWANHLVQVHEGLDARETGMRLQDKCLDQISRWAAHPDQSVERLDQAIRDFDRLVYEVPAPSRAHGFAFEATLERMRAAGDMELVPDHGSVWGPSVTQFTLRWMPWETERLHRCYARSFRRQMGFWRELEDHVKAWPDKSTGQGYIDSYEDLSWSYAPLWRTDVLQELLIHADWKHRLMGRMWNSALMELTLVTRQRATRLAMELHRWRTTHGSLPDSLEAIALPGGVPVSAHGGIPVLLVPSSMADLPKPYSYLVPWKYTEARATQDLPPHLLYAAHELGDISLVYE